MAFERLPDTLPMDATTTAKTNCRVRRGPCVKYQFAGFSDDEFLTPKYTLRCQTYGSIFFFSRPPARILNIF